MPNIAILTPLRFVDLSDIDNSFDGNFWINQKFNFFNPKCYFQKWQFSDTLNLQFISDFVPENIVFRDFATGRNVGSVSWNEVNTAIVGQTFKVYELQYQWSALPEGKYYAEFSYTDADLLEHILISEPIDLRDVHEETILLKYKHSQNDFDIIFNTGIEFQFRVEAKIKLVDLKNKRNIYTDQKVNPTLLSATPYRQFKFYLGRTKGVPGWVADKVNFIQSVDQVRYDDVYYQIPEGSEYEFTTIEYNSYIAGDIDLQPTDNNFSRYQTEIPDGATTFTPMQKVTPYLNRSDNFAVANLFNAFSILEKICIRKRSLTDLIINIGITPGGSEIGRFQIDDTEFTQTIEWLFNGTQTVFITGLLGADCDFWVIWKQLDEPPIDLNDNSVVVAPVGKGTVTMFHGTQEEIDIAFDMSTGLGRENTNFFGWAVMDGRNGLGESWAGRVPVGQNFDDEDFLEVGQVGGSKTHQLILDELPKFTPDFQHGYSRRGNTGSSLVLDDFNADNTKTGNEVGGDQPHNNLQPYVVTMFIKKIS